MSTQNSRSDVISLITVYDWITSKLNCQQGVLSVDKKNIDEYSGD